MGMGACDHEIAFSDDFLSKLKSSLHEHGNFFDRLVELIPARFYLPADENAVHLHRGMSKKEKAAAHRASKENLKLARRARLDPEKFSSTLELVKKNAEKEEQEKLEESGTENIKGSEPTEGRSLATYEELRERLHRRIEELQSKRNTGTADTSHRSKKEKKKDSQKNKRKHEALAHATSSSSPAEEKEPSSAKRAKTKPAMTAKESNENNASSLEFGRVKIGIGNDKIKDSCKKHKESKAHLLEKATKLQSVMQDPEKGQVVATEHSWSVAAKRAAGAKVLDDPKLLKQSIKKEKKEQQKHAKKWKERTEQQAKAAEARQQQRRENIAQKIQQKKERRIAKREKKLLRPGFEGRKEGFINS